MKIPQKQSEILVVFNLNSVSVILEKHKTKVIISPGAKGHKSMTLVIIGTLSIILHHNFVIGGSLLTRPREIQKFSYSPVR